MKKDSEFIWRISLETAFNLLKSVFIYNPVLQLYKPDSETELHCDASAVGISGMLLQKGTDQKFHLVYVVSIKTAEAENMYHSSRLELMAIIWSVSRLRHLLIGIRFTIVTDCQALVHLNTKKTQVLQVFRWASFLSEYDCDMKHLPGEKMYLSRALVDDLMTSRGKLWNTWRY